MNNNLKINCNFLNTNYTQSTFDYDGHLEGLVDQYFTDDNDHYNN